MKKCFVCRHNVLKDGKSTRLFEENGSITVVKDVPCKVCSNCGEEYLMTATVRQLEKILGSHNAELEVVNFHKLVA